MISSYLNFRSCDLDKPIYRFVTFGRLIELFQSSLFPLARTEKWDDPFENFIVSVRFTKGSSSLDLSLRHVVHGSCWTRKAVSDALWRIYSQDKLSVRIGSTPRLIGVALSNALAGFPRSKWFIGRVQYLPQERIVKSAENLALAILEDKSETAAAQSVLLKRRSFMHEDEVRVLVIDRHGKSKGGIIKLKVNPHEVIRSVMIDSRAPPQIAEMYVSYLRQAIAFEGRISKSTLYDLPTPLVIARR